MKRNIKQKNVSNVLHLLMLAFLFLWCGSANAEVQGSGTKSDPYVLESGTSYDVGMWTSVYAKFTAPSAGKFVLINSNEPYVYTDATFSTPDTSVKWSYNGGFGENRKTLSKLRPARPIMWILVI